VTLRLLDEAKEEMRESARWYEDKRAGLGDDFLDAVERALELIEAHHKRYQRLQVNDPDREIRRYLLKRFPFLVVYEVCADEILVVAIAHGKRKPKYWQDRLE
jgi:toxin ParE1/3/4